MQITVLGGCGAWPEAGKPCTGFLVEQDGFRLVLDLGFATLPQLSRYLAVDEVDAVLVSHGHPDHCADVNPLLRARALGSRPSVALPLYSPPGALNAVLALDRPGMLDTACVLRPFAPGAQLVIGPFQVATRLLPHWLPNAGVRLSAGGQSMVYTGDAGPHPALAELAGNVDVLVAEATFVDETPVDSQGLLSSARHVGGVAEAAGVGRLVLTHLWPGTDPEAARDAAGTGYQGKIDVAASGMTINP